MRQRVKISPNQQVNRLDFQNFGLFPQGSFDALIENLLIPDRKFSGFQVSQGVGTQIIVSPGELWLDGQDYYNDTVGGEVISLADQRPVVSQRYVAIAATGAEVDVVPQARRFMVDVETDSIVVADTATEVRRWAGLSVIPGAVNADPQRPTVGAPAIVVAWVLLNSSGIVSITRATENEAPNLTELEGELTALNAWKAIIEGIIATLQSDLAGLARKLADMASAKFVTLLAADMARVKEKLQLPSAWSAYHADYFISTTQSDTTNVDYLAEIQDGVRFPPAAVSDSQLALLDPFDPLMTVQDQFALPKYTEATRLNVIQKTAFGDDVNGPISIPISNYPFISGAFFRKLLRARARYRYGPELPSIRSTAQYFTQSGAGTQNDPVAELFRLNDSEVFETPNEDENQVSLFDPRRNPGVWLDRLKGVGYWYKRVVTFNVSGSGLCQTFFNAQDGWLTSIEFALSDIGASGDMTVVILECDANGLPQFKRALASTTVLHADLKTKAWDPDRTTKANFTPTFLFAGQRYGALVMSSGNHRFWLVQRNKYTQGQLFAVTSDGVVSTVTLGSTGLQINEPDLGIRLNFALFDSPRTVVNMAPLSLSGGIAKVDVLAEAIVPPQGSIAHEVQVGGVWKNLNDQVPAGSHAFAGLPALVPYRIVLNGTTDAMPGIGLGASSRVRTSRARSDFKHISTAINSPATTQIKAFYRVENWRTSGQVVNFRLMTGSGFTTLTAPTVTVASVAPDDPNAQEVQLTWSGLSSLTTFKLQAFGTSDNVLSNYHLAQRVDVET
jgi:hypothetical protein